MGKRKRRGNPQKGNRRVNPKKVKLHRQERVGKNPRKRNRVRKERVNKNMRDKGMKQAVHSDARYDKYYSRKKIPKELRVTEDEMKKGYGVYDLEYVKSKGVRVIEWDGV